MPVNARPVLLVLLGVLVAGCTSASLDQRPAGMTCYGEASAQWTEPGIHDRVAALPENASRSIEVEPHMPHATIAFEAPALGERWGQHALVAATYRTDDAWIRAFALRPGELHIETSPGLDVAQALALFDALLGATGLSEAPERPAWERALATSLEHGGRAEVILLAQPDLSDLAARVESGEAREAAHGAIGHRALDVGAWRLHFALAQWRITDGRAWETVTIMVDPTDEVRARTMLSKGEEPWPALQVRVSGTFEALGLGEPGWARARGGSGTPPSC